MGSSFFISCGPVLTNLMATQYFLLANFKCQKIKVGLIGEMYHAHCLIRRSLHAQGLRKLTSPSRMYHGKKLLISIVVLAVRNLAKLI
jgi:hypothetical protein